MLAAPIRLIMRIIRGFLEHPLAAIVFVLAFIGGVAVSDSWVGHLIGWAINLLPDGAPQVAFCLSVFVIACDLFRDGIAERFAIYLALVTPSFAMAIPKDAKLHEKLNTWIVDLNNWVDRTIGPWLVGSHKNVALTIIGMICIAVAVAWCERYAKNGSQQMAAPAGAATGAPVTTTAAPTPVRRRAR